MTADLSLGAGHFPGCPGPQRELDEALTAVPAARGGSERFPGWQAGIAWHLGTAAWPAVGDVPEPADFQVVALGTGELAAIKPLRKTGVSTGSGYLPYRGETEAQSGR